MRSFKIALAVAACPVLGWFAACSAAPAQGAFLITINDSNPSAITFTATGSPPAFADSSHSFAQGLGFANFFAAAPPTLDLFPTIAATSTTLTTGVDGTPDYAAAQSASFSGSLTGDLEVSGTSGATPSGNTENFNTGTPAFTGTATFDFAASSFYAPGILPTPGTTGELFAGVGGILGRQSEIGTYQVAAVPEPTEGSLMLLCGAGLALLRLRNRGGVSVL